MKPRYRLAVDASLAPHVRVALRDNAAHYLTGVLRLGVGDAVALFNRADGEWRATIEEIRKKELVLEVVECTRAPSARGMEQRPPSARGMELMVCFAPIKGGRLETIIEKATELGASVLQPVITARTIVDKVNLARAEAIAREAAEQCDRIDWPEIREPLKLLNLLGGWPDAVPLIYGDESGAGVPVTMLTRQTKPQRWGILTGPEGGFTPDELAALGRVTSAQGVGLGPRILRADTAVITLCTATLMAWGDWDQPPRFYNQDSLNLNCPE